MKVKGATNEGGGAGATAGKFGLRVLLTWLLKILHKINALKGE